MQKTCENGTGWFAFDMTMNAKLAIDSAIMRAILPKMGLVFLYSIFIKTFLTFQSVASNLILSEDSSNYVLFSTLSNIYINISSVASGA